ncbi:M20 family peptidase [Proteinivorax tanatarense]|uniref:M20 family peptidase n=1 Tax=Proteinivorax tanatarense TaxID=1260629 RepID=A0AAU7VK76_9FIRM
MLTLLTVTILVILLIILIQTLTFKKKGTVKCAPKSININTERALQRFSEMVKCRTISYSDKKRIDYNEFKKLHYIIEKNYPNIQKKLKKETIDHSVIYKWQGQDRTLKPALLIAHLDVVPVEGGTEKDWCHEPFSGEIADGFIWGRGTLDMKVQLFAILEVVENLLSQNFAPKRDIYLAFGQDEEVGGLDGAAKIAELFKDRGLEFEYVLDEGGCVTEDILKEVATPVAVVGVAEKGYADVEISCQDSGGHSSMPPQNTAVGVLCKSIVKLEQKQLKTKITSPVKEMLENIGPEMSFTNKVIIANMWLFKPLFKSVFSKSKTGNALLRTTTASTVIQGSDASNVLPQHAKAIINFRILPGETSEDVVKHVINTINDNRVSVRLIKKWEPSEITTSPSNDTFEKIKLTIQKVFPEAIVTPYLVIGGTDGKKYEMISDNVYRFTPIKVEASEINRMHNTNERVSVENVKRSLRFFNELVQNS